MKKLLSLSGHRGAWNGSSSSLHANTRSIQVVRGAYNIDLNKVDSSFSKLHRACLLNDDIQVKKYIHKVDNNSHDSSQRYPIHLATVNGNLEIIRLLIENGADPNVQDSEKNTPLIKAIECSHEHLVKYLLSNGANPNICDLDNNSALHWAMMTESILAIDALISSRKCDVSLRNNKDETCLHLAVRNPLVEGSTFESIIKAGADVRAKDQLGLSPLDIAHACSNRVAINVFNRYDQEANVKSLCEEYRMKYMIKNRENLEYEKQVIQLKAQLERLKIDLGFLKERNEELLKSHEGRAVECQGYDEFMRARTILQDRINKLVMKPDYC